MNKRGETVKFIIITLAAFLVIGLGFVTFSQKAGISGATTKSTMCAELVDGQTELLPLEQCCIEIKRSNGCITNGEYFVCEGLKKVMVNEDTIRTCQ